MSEDSEADDYPDSFLSNPLAHLTLLFLISIFVALTMTKPGYQTDTSTSEEDRCCTSVATTPIKYSVRNAIRSNLRSSDINQIRTPEKPTDPPRFPRGHGVIYSLKQVKRAAASASGLKNKEKETGIGNEDIIAEHQMIEYDHGLGCVDFSPKRLKRKKPDVDILEKYEILAKFFKCMENSISLLRLKGQTSTFSNICPKIEHLTDMRFSYSNLAQLKYILPEAILLKKILSHDEMTGCMNHDLQINVVVDAFGDIAKQKQKNGYSFLTTIFRKRLEDFHKDHPMGDDVPEGSLPEPFNYEKPSKTLKMTEHSCPSFTSSTSSELNHLISEKQLAVASHLPESFKRRFSERSSDKDVLMLHTKLSKMESSCSMVSSPTIARESCFSTANQLSLQSPKDGSPNEDEKESVTGESSDCPTTPAKYVSTPIRMMPHTSQPSTPKGSDTKIDDILTPVKKNVRRSLYLTVEKCDEPKDAAAEAFADNSDDAVLSFLPKSLLQSVKEKERKVMEEQQIRASKSKRRELISGLPKLFDIIHLIFQSAKRSIITKEELVEKIIASHLNIVDGKQVEEELKLLEEIVPEWISGKTSINGGYVLCVNKITRPVLIRQKLAEAK